MGLLTAIESNRRRVLREKLEESERKADEQREIIAIQQSSISVLEFKSRVPKLNLSDMTEAAKKRLSKYNVVKPKRPINCIDCEHMIWKTNYSDMKLSFCSEKDHRVNWRYGSCPCNTAEKQQGQLNEYEV